MQAKVKRSKPEVIGINAQFLVEEAELLCKFLAPTKFATIEALLPDESYVIQQKINDLLYVIFNNLTDAIDEAIA